jgi:hypothetical protein
MKYIFWIMVAVCLIAAQAWAASVNIDFEAYGDNLPANTYGAAAGQSGTWNGLKFISENSNLVYSGNLLGLDGQPSGISYSATGISYPGSGASNNLLLKDNFWAASYAPNPYWSVTLTGLVNGLYDVYVYAPTHSAIPTGIFTVNGTAASSFGYATSGPGTNGLDGLDLGIDYIVLSNLYIGAGSLNLVQTGYGVYYDYQGKLQNAYMAGLAGIQLVGAGAPVPIPGAVWLLGSGLIGLVALKKKLKL